VLIGPQRGVTLLEVLVTLLVTSIGLLGLAGLQLTSMQGTNSAAQRFEASTLAYDILERMRSNRPQALLGAYGIDLGEAAPGGDAAANDLRDWKIALAGLPDGDGAVATAGNRVTVTVRWTDASAANPGGSRVAFVRLQSEL
jgi:type IV pilus assembly protein PilV